MQRDPKVYDELYEFIFKIMIPALVGIAAKVAIQMKNEKLSIGRVIISFIAGTAFAYFAYPFVGHFSNEDYIPAVIGLSAISGEKITEWVVYKFKIDTFLGVLFDVLIERVKGKK